MSKYTALLPAKNVSDNDRVLFFTVSNKFPSTEVKSCQRSDVPTKICKRSNESRNFAEFPLGNHDGWYCKTFTTRIMMRSAVGRVCENVKKGRERKRIASALRSHVDSYSARFHRERYDFHAFLCPTFIERIYNDKNLIKAAALLAPSARMNRVARRKSSALDYNRCTL